MVKKLNLDVFVQKVNQIGKDAIASVVLYGSHTEGDACNQTAGFNILILVHKLDVVLLQSFSSLSITWVKQGNPVPFFFTVKDYQTSVDVFPIESLDIKNHHTILSGEDFISDISVSMACFRIELEHELKGKVIQIREKFLLTSHKEKLVLSLMMDSLSTFLVLFRSVLRLYSEHDGQKLKMDALHTLQEHVSFDIAPFLTLRNIAMEGNKKLKVNVLELFSQYLTNIDIIIDAVDKMYFHPSKKA